MCNSELKYYFIPKISFVKVCCHSNQNELKTFFEMIFENSAFCNITNTLFNNEVFIFNTV